MKCPSCQAFNADTATSCVSCEATLTPTAVRLSVKLDPGTLFHNRYEIQETLGRGGMGMVYKALDRTLEETVAIKVLRPEFAEDPKMAQRFKSEIKLARKVRHKNVCTIHDFGEDQGLLFISMETIEGTDLKKVLTERGGLPPEEAYDVAIQVAEGLQAVHDTHIIHRDLKAPNIMLEPDGKVRLMDFGIAKREGAEGTMTATGHIVGTPDYMSPEQAQGHKLDYRSDVYALGIVTWEIFTGRVPFRGETPISTILKHINEPPPLDGPQASALPAALRPVLRKALAKSPTDRHASAEEFAEALKMARSPSRRQQPIDTASLSAPTMDAPAAGPAPTVAAGTVPTVTADAATADEAPATVLTTPSRKVSRPTARPRRGFPLWLLAIPVVLGAGVVWMVGRGGEPVPEGPTVAAATQAPATTLAPSAAATPEALSTPEVSAAVPAATAPPATVRRAPEPTPRPTRRPTPAPTPRATPEPTPRATPAPTPEAPAVAPAVTEAAKPAGAGLLHVVVRPWGQVTVDGKVLGTTPFPAVPMPSGRHTVSVRHPAYEILEREAVVEDGKIAKIVIDLPKEGVRK